MSAGVRVPLATAEVLADEVVELLRPACERIEVAGSIRRRRPDVGDIEVVAVPRMAEESEGLWGEPVSHDLLADRLASLHDTLGPRAVIVHRADGTEETSQRRGDRYQALAYRDVPVDLFIVRPPAEWGVVFTIRTGPADWSARLVTDCQRRFFRVKDGQLLQLGRPVPCPEERHFLAALGQPWVEPAARTAAAVRLP